LPEVPGTNRTARASAGRKSGYPRQVCPTESHLKSELRAEWLELFDRCNDSAQSLVGFIRDWC